MVPQMDLERKLVIIWAPFSVGIKLQTQGGALQIWGKKDDEGFRCTQCTNVCAPQAKMSLMNHKLGHLSLLGVFRLVNSRL